MPWCRRIRRPQLIRGNRQLLFDGMRVSEAAVLVLKNKSHSVTASITVPASGATGVIITQGGRAVGRSGGRAVGRADGRCTRTRVG
jgi:arylsulfatase